MSKTKTAADIAQQNEPYAGEQTVGALVEAIAALSERERDFLADQLDQLDTIATLGGERAPA